MFAPAPRTRIDRFIQDHSNTSKVPLEDVFKKLKRFNAKDAPSFQDAMLEFGSGCPGSTAATDLAEVMAEVAALRANRLRDDPLTDDQVGVLLEWLKQRHTSLYSEINRRTHNRHIESMDPIRTAEYVLLRALAALPSAGNPEVTRGITTDVASSLIRGKMITWYAPTSTTLGPAAMDFSGTPGSPGTVLRIKLTQGLGRDISKYSQFPDEQEIVLPPGSTFLVKDVSSKNGVSTIILEEITPQPLIVPMVGELDACGKDIVFNNQNIIFCGNPGTGKSTLLNGLIGPGEEGQLLFKSGLSIGKGLTFDFDSHQGPDNTIYMDTPGLSDISMRQKAAKAIVKAFNSGGFYRLFFVITLEAGRFKADDKTTMNLVLEAVPELVEFGIIINKASQEVMDVLKDPEEMEDFLDVIFSDSGSRRTNHVFMNAFEAGLNDKNCVYRMASADFKSFITGIKPVFVKDAAAIDPSDFEQKKQQLEESITREEQVNTQLSETKLAAKLAGECAAKECAEASAKATKAKEAEQVALAAQNKSAKEAAEATAAAKTAKQEAATANTKAATAQKEAEKAKDLEIKLMTQKAQHQAELKKVQEDTANELASAKANQNLSNLRARVGGWVDESLRCKNTTKLVWTTSKNDGGYKAGSLCVSNGHRGTLQAPHALPGRVLVLWDHGSDPGSGRVVNNPVSCIGKVDGSTDDGCITM